MNAKTTTAIPLLAVLLILAVSGQLWAEGGAPLGKPAWTTPLAQSTDNGEARFEWAPKRGDVVELYRITENAFGREGVFYATGQALEVYRVDPGNYRFSLQACNKNADGIPACGPPSRPLVLTVTEEIRANDPVTDEGPTLVTQNVVGGPDELRPGLWFNPAKNGEGWSFYWANRLALSQNPSNAYDLYVIWYTYEAKTRTITPICEPPQPPCGNDTEYFNYWPVVATMELVKASTGNNYVGAITIKRGSTTFNVGDATVVFGAGNTSATINWSAAFKKQSLSLVTDGIQLLAGSSGTSTNDVSHYAGLWGNTNAGDYIIDDVGSLSEAIQAVFYDDNGDPTWIEAFRSATPVATNTSLCFYHIQGGFPPNQNQATLPGPLFTTCDPDNATSTNRNGRRYFSGFEVARYWVSFTLPAGVTDPNKVAGGSVTIGTSGTPATKTKAANFHRIWFNGGNSCQISAATPSCSTTLTWFTDGDYPDASAFAYNQNTGQRALIATSTDPAMINRPVTLSAAGTYVFELRMSHSASSTLMAQSSAFTVTFVSGSPVAPTGLAAMWTKEANREYVVQWNHADPANVDFYELVETFPSGSATTYTLAPGTTQSKAFNRLTGPFGTYGYRVRACANTAGCSADTPSIDWTVNAPPPGNTPPVVTSPGKQSTPQGTTITPLVIAVTDAENDPVTCTITGLPVALAETSECVIGGTITAAAGTYPVTVTASDGTDQSAPVTFNWIVTTPGTVASPDTPPAPAAAPSMTPSASSSRVGATAGAFRVDESGNATYRIPLLTAPGAGGLAPGLSLDYSSQGGNGPLGVGWTLGGQSAISRCAQTLAVDSSNAVRGVTLTATDRFCLDGQRLIAVAGVYGAGGSEYRTEIDPIAKIVSNGTAGTGPQSFTVWRKDGSATQYGASTDSRMEARTASDTQTVLVWAQNRITDAAGNYIDYVYTEIAGVAGAPVEHVLDKVLYTGNTTAGTAPYAEFNFIYTTARLDATLAYVGGAALQQARLLTRIDSRARVNAGSTLETLRSYLLAYGTDGHGRQILTSVTECRDATQTYCFAPTTFDWQKSKHGVGTSATSVGSLFDSQHAATAMADVTGDGRPDLLLTRKKGSGFEFRVLPALSNGGFGSSAAYYPIPNNGSSATPATLHAIDLNADGFQDVIYPTTSGWKGRLSVNGTLGSEIALGACCDLGEQPLVQVMDFDGDGLSDVVTQRAKPDGGKETVWLRNQFTPASPTVVGFAAPLVLNIAVDANLFPASSGNWFIDTELPEFRVQNALTRAFRRPFDYDGDGRVDLLAQITQRYFQCSGSCNLNSQPSSGNTRVLPEFTISDSANAPAANASGGSFAWAS